MPVVEICKWIMSDLFVSDPFVIKPALDYLVNVDGCLRYAQVSNLSLSYLLTRVLPFSSVYYGFGEENNMTCFLILSMSRKSASFSLSNLLIIWLLSVWETYGHHESLMNRPEYPQIIGLSPSVGAGGIQMNHIEFIHDFIPLFDAPSTEILTLKLKEGKSKEDVYNILQALVPKVAALNDKYAPGSWGQTLEETDKFYLVTGWDSMKVGSFSSLLKCPYPHRYSRLI